ncbi:MAG TPA: hypothetical protein VGI39_35700 [Polyangiaceae bacterium]
MARPARDIRRGDRERLGRYVAQFKRAPGTASPPFEQYAVDLQHEAEERTA